MASLLGPPINDAVPLTFKVTLTLPIKLGGMVAAIALFLLALYITRSTYHRLFPAPDKPDPNPNITLSRRPTATAATLARSNTQGQAPYDEFAQPSLPLSNPLCPSPAQSHGKRPSTAQRLGRMLTTVRRAKSQRHHQHMQELLAKQQSNMQSVVAAANAANNSNSANMRRSDSAYLEQPSPSSARPDTHGHSTALTSSLFAAAAEGSPSRVSQPSAAWRPNSEMPPMPPLPPSLTLPRGDPSPSDSRWTTSSR